MIRRGRKRQKREVKELEKETSKEEDDSMGGLLDILDDDEIDSDISSQNEELSDVDPFADETAEEKKVRLAKKYLKSIEKELEMEGEEDGPVSLDQLVGQRLQDDVLKQTGRYQRRVAISLLDDSGNYGSINYSMHSRGHKLPATCVTTFDSFAFTGSKDCTVVKWDVDSGKKILTFPGRRGSSESNVSQHEILSVCVSHDGRYLVSGGRDRIIRVWDGRTGQHVDSLKGHRDAITGVTFRNGTLTLYSTSFDRTVRIWSLQEMGYLDTLYGHQSEATAVDALARERCITCGRDATCRQWKVPEQSQLTFRAGGHCVGIDCLAYLSDERFISGSDDGSLSLWSTIKKKPMNIVQFAHSGSAGPSQSHPHNTPGKKEQPSDAASKFLSRMGLVSEETSQPHITFEHDGNPNWVSSVAGLQYSDLAASGSCDGYIRFWRVGLAPGEVEDEYSRKERGMLNPVGCTQVDGWVNGLSFDQEGRFLACAVGQEHRLGRWNKIKHVRNGLCVIPLSLTDEST